MAGPPGILPIWISSNGSLRSWVNRYIKNTWGITSLKALSANQVQQVIELARRHGSADEKFAPLTPERLLELRTQELQFEDININLIKTYTLGVANGWSGYDHRILHTLVEAAKALGILTDQPQKTIADITVTLTDDNEADESD